MKHLLSFIFFLLTALTAASQTVGMSAFGYGRNATGGGSATPTLVSSKSQLENALRGTTARVVIITQDITVSHVLDVQSAKNLTLMALPGVKLKNMQQDAANSGILYFRSCSNIILRNLTFVGPGAYDCDGWDLLCFDGVTNAWVDHCDFQDGVDGNYDNKGKTDNVTVSWCRFRYLQAPRAGGSGGADDHRYSNLLGSSSSDKPADGTYNFTWAYCWWDNGCRERMVRGRNASLHFLNCYWSSNVANYYIGPENMDAYIEGCYFGGNATLAKTFYQNYNGTNGAKFINSYSNKGTLSNVTGRAVVQPTYSYTALTYAEAKNAISDATCGAGATLLVARDGMVSSACGENGPVTPPTGPTTDTYAVPSAQQTVSTFWNFSDTDFSSLGTLSDNHEVRNLLMAAGSDNTIVIESSSKSVDNIAFTTRLKTGGGMSSAGRYLAFSVTGNCIIDVYAISSNSSTDRQMLLYADTTQNARPSGDISYSSSLISQSSLTIPGDALRKFTFTYIGPAANLYIGSENGGLNPYGIRLTYSNNGTALNLLKAQPKTIKTIIDGHLVIEHEGIRYNALGQRL